MKTFSATLLLLALESSTISSFVIAPATTSLSSSSTRNTLDRVVSEPTASTTSTRLNAGFGGDSPKKKKEIKIKPKQQWDRYLGDLKKEKPFRVAVKGEGKESDEWLEVGNVKSKDGANTMAAVARQRALIAEHAKRLFPMQISTKDRVEWAYWDAEDWVIADKNVLDTEDIPAGFEKMIGFEGRPDPGTGYYCMYNEGRLVTGDGDPLERASKKVQ